MHTLTITKPDDWHIHLRQGQALTTTIPHTAPYFARAAVMPNTIPPITDVTSALQYKNNILALLGKNDNFNPLMTLYLTDNTSPNIIKQAALSRDIIACKLYPQGATTNSDAGVSDIKKIYPVLDTMQETNLPLLIHGETTDHNIDIFEREAIFIDKILVNIREQFPNLKITLEHITTKQAVDFVLEYKQNSKTAATITPHHLLLNRNDLLVGGIKPHYYCLPILKDRSHQDAVIQAALSGEPCFFAGSDSAPHSINKKEAACGCAGIYHGSNTTLIYADFFDQHKQLEKLEAFISFYGADYYNLPYNKEKITLIKDNYTIPEHYQYEETIIIPFLAGQTIAWRYA
jgi:dihydroorotase